MKKTKNLIITSFIPFIVPIIPLTISCSNSVSNHIQSIAQNYKLEILPNKKAEALNKLSSEIDTKQKLEEFIGTWKSNVDGVNVEYIKSYPKTNFQSILVVECKFTYENISEIKEVEVFGFKKSDSEIVNEYIENLPTPKIKTDKIKQQSQTYTNSINTEEILNQWFDDLPQSDIENQINIEYQSSNSYKYDSSILEINYKATKNDFSNNIIFLIEGFKDEIVEFSNFEDYSKRNSFKISLLHRKFSILYNGTAWSWYYKKHSESLYDWYLMTNFHVVSEMIANSLGFRTSTIDSYNPTNARILIDYYSEYYSTNLDLSQTYFDLQIWDNNQYKTLVHTNSSSNTNLYPDSVGWKSKNPYVKSLEIITDFNNDKINLFSYSENNKVKHNLDMALVKVSFDFKDQASRFVKDNYCRQNIVNLHSRTNNKEMELDFNKNINIGGNPVQFNQLEIYNSNHNLSKAYEYQNLSYDDPVFSLLKAPYYYLTGNESNFKLTGGASGSAVYQLDDPNSIINWNNNLPIGIYWGNKVLWNDLINPSLIPFIFNGPDTKYNIFDLFEEYLKTN